LIQRSSRNEQGRLTIPLIAIIGFQLMYETVVATLALTHIIPPDALVCDLEKRWRKLAAAEDADAIRAIQDSFKCCGFNTMKDAAFPWGEPSNCAEVFPYTKSCKKDWRKAEQINAGLLLLVAVIVFILKVCMRMVGSGLELIDGCRCFQSSRSLAVPLGLNQDGCALSIESEMKL
jgi:hypothetical protein